METLWCFVVGFMVFAGIYLMLEKHILKILFGLTLLSNAVNLAIFTAGRLTIGSPPLIDKAVNIPEAGYANPLPQALILTAIVIGFGLLLFALTLSYRAYYENKTADVDTIGQSESEGIK